METGNGQKSKNFSVKTPKNQHKKRHYDERKRAEKVQKSAAIRANMHKTRRKSTEQKRGDLTIL